MSKHHPSHRLVKTHRNYTVDDIASLLGIHRNTVRRWLSDGLPVIDNKRPTLVLGADLAEFLKERRTKNKRPCKPGEIYCVRCRLPQKPAGAMAEFQQQTGQLGNLVGICPVCEAMIYRRANVAKLDAVRGQLDITISKAELHLSDSGVPPVYSDFK